MMCIDSCKCIDKLININLYIINIQILASKNYTNLDTIVYEK